METVLTRHALIAITALCLAVPPAEAARHALLVGISQYDQTRNHPGFKPLAGPANDVAAMQKLLREKWHFDSIRILQDKAATRASILDALDKLAADTAKGDFIFVYFSGHGTSGFNVKAVQNGFAVDHSTGAIVPWDLPNKSAPKDLLDGLVIGSRDLLPRFVKLDEKAEVLAAFDACYSGNSSKALASATLDRRYGDLVPPNIDRRDALDRMDATALANLKPSPEKPYHNLIYLSASAASETAADVGPGAINAGRRTYDGLPHGAFTSALLEGLAGGATGPDGNITYASLHRFVTRTVEGQYGQSPQLKNDTDNPDLPSRQLFGEAAPAAPKARRGLPLRLKYAQPEPAVAKLLAGTPNLEIVSGAYDLVLERAAGTATAEWQFVVRHASGGELLVAAPDDAKKVANAIRGQARAKTLADLRFNDFGVGLEILPNQPPMDREVFYDKEKMHFELAPDRRAWLVLLNINASGKVSIVFPWNDDNPAPTYKARTTDSDVSGPFGLETMKVFAFETQPPDYEWLRGHPRIEPNSEDFEKLLKLVRESPGPKGEYLRLVYTRKSRESEIKP
jgi:hypothetical protein